MIFMENHLTFCVFMSILFLSFLAAIIQVCHQLWWKPMQTQHFLQSQGIKGPPFVFLDGNSTEILERKMNSLSRKMQLSDDVFIALQPHVHLWIKIYGKNFLHWPGARAELVISEMELIEQLLNDKEGCFYRSENGNYLKKILGGENLADEMLHNERLEKMIPWMVESVEVMIGMWKNYEGKDFDVFEEFGFLSAEITSRAAFGRPHYEIFHMLRKLIFIAAKSSSRVKPSVIKMMFKYGDDSKAKKLEKGIRNFVSVIVRKRQSMLVDGEDFLGLLLKEHDEKISIEEIINKCVVFYSAGQSTVTSMLSWTIVLLAIHQDWQEKAREEVLRLFAQGAPNSEGISRLKMISMIINESLRLYPPSVYSERKARQGAKLGKYILPAGISIHVPILAIHHDPKIWGEDAHIFNPERFSNGGAFLPFLGAKTCFGANFATFQAKIILFMILQRYSFTLSPSYVHSPIDVPFLRPQYGVQVILQALR